LQTKKSPAPTPMGISHIMSGNFTWLTTSWVL